MRIILEENILVVPFAQQASFRMGKNEEKSRVDLTSIMSATKPIELVDSHNYTPTSQGKNYRVLTEVCGKENYNTLTQKVDEVVPNLFDPQKGLEEGVNRAVEVVSSSGTCEFTFGIGLDNDKLCLTGTAGDFSISVSLPKTLLKHNKAYDEQADMMRAVYMLLFRCLNIDFIRTLEREKGFKKLIKHLWA